MFYLHQHSLNGPYPEFRYYILEMTSNVQHRNKWWRVYKNQVFIFNWKLSKVVFYHFWDMFTKNLFWSRIFKWFWMMNRFMTNLRHFIQSLYLREKGRMCLHPNGQIFGMSFSALHYESFLCSSSIYWSILVYIQLYEVFMKTVAAHPLPWQGDKVLWH